MSSRGAALQASVAKSCMPPKALSRFAERGEIRGRRHRRARWTFHSGQRPLHSGRYGPCSGHSGEARDRLWRGGSRPPISVNSHPSPVSVRAKAPGPLTTSVSACLAAAAVTPRQIRRFSVTWKPGKFAPRVSRGRPVDVAFPSDGFWKLPSSRRFEVTARSTWHFQVSLGDGPK